MSKTTQYDKMGDVVELGDDFFENAKPLDAFPTLKTKLGRGKQKAPTKEAVTIRYSPKVTKYFRSTGKGWQARMDKVLSDYVDSLTEKT